MMLSLDGRNYFYQWDTNQKITSNSFVVGDEIHFYNNKQSMALVTAAYEFEGKVVADVPNCLLESSYPIIVYRYIYNKDSGYTIDRQNFDVQQRAKPDHYVYEETELYTIKTAVDKALLDAKERGDFDGEDGYTPRKGVDYFDGEDGKDGVSCEHRWDGTKLVITSASGTSSAELKGEKGDKYTLTDSDKQEIVAAVLTKFNSIGIVQLTDEKTAKQYKLSVVNGKLTMSEV